MQGTRADAVRSPRTQDVYLLGGEMANILASRPGCLAGRFCSQSASDHDSPCKLSVRSSSQRDRLGWKTQCAAQRNNFGVPDSAQKGWEQPDVAELFREAELNIMRLNESRLKALEELKEARRRIWELENRLSDAVAGRLGPPEAGQLDASSSAGGAILEFASPLIKEIPTSAQDAAGDADRQVAQHSNSQVTIVYGTGWEEAFIHFKLAGKEWTKAPGLLMQPGSGGYAESKVMTIESGGSLEFVMNNGKNSWDSPDPYGKGTTNYIVDSPGTYFLKSGRLQKLS